MTDLNKKYSRYDGTEVVRRVLCPSKSSKCMFKNSKVCRNRAGATAGSSVNVTSACVIHFRVGKRSRSRIGVFVQTGADCMHAVHTWKGSSSGFAERGLLH